MKKDGYWLPSWLMHCLIPVTLSAFLGGVTFMGVTMQYPGRIDIQIGRGGLGLTIEGQPTCPP